MRLGMIGLGRMGNDMVRRLMGKGLECVVYDVHPNVVQQLQRQGAIGAASLESLVSQLPKPRVVWLMLPAAIVDQELTKLSPLLEAGDIVIDGGNSYYRDDIRRANTLKSHEIHYLDVGTSGGVFGFERGYCLMIGGEPATVSYLAPVFSALAPGTGTVSRTPGRNRPGDASHSAHASSLSGEHDNAAVNTAEQGYLHCGPHGAGHFVKMIHNGIEYGMMAAYAEGFNILHNANIGKQSHEVDAETTPLQDPQFYQYEFNLPDIAEVWRRGSVISSWLLDLTAGALNNDPALAGYEGRVSDSGEGRWTLRAALDEAVPVPVLSAALYARFSSRGQADFANKVLSAMRHQFGGHAEKSTQKPGD